MTRIAPRRQTFAQPATPPPAPPKPRRSPPHALHGPPLYTSGGGIGASAWRGLRGKVRRGERKRHGHASRGKGTHARGNRIAHRVRERAARRGAAAAGRVLPAQLAAYPPADDESCCRTIGLVLQAAPPLAADTRRRPLN
eukprot:scaffold13002_cov125-Isochrysis_galbana.AAC.7